MPVLFVAGSPAAQADSISERKKDLTGQLNELRESLEGTSDDLVNAAVKLKGLRAAQDKPNGGWFLTGGRDTTGKTVQTTTDCEISAAKPSCELWIIENMDGDPFIRPGSSVRLRSSACRSTGRSSW